MWTTKYIFIKIQICQINEMIKGFVDAFDI